MARIRLATRGDDLGSSASANAAIREAVEHGLLRNVSVMVPGPAFAEAAEWLRSSPDVDVGLHIVINSEWDFPKWGPVSAAPSLVDADGFFWKTPAESQAQGASPAEILAETEAQLAQAKAAGLRLAYLDEHMGLSWPWPEVRAGLAALAAREGLADIDPRVPDLPGGPVTGDPVGDLIARLEAAPPGDYRLITHPGLDAPDLQAIRGEGVPPGRIARERDGDRRLLLDPRLRDACRALDVQVVRFSEIL